MKKRLYLFITVCWMAAMGTLLFYPYDYVSGAVEKITYYDKLGHLMMFGVLTYLLLIIGIRWKPRKFFWIFLVVFSFSVVANFSAEFIQAFIPGRDPSFFDFIAGIAGIIIAIPIAYFLNYKPRQKTVLHVCCAPCATAVRESLEAGHRLEFFFSNSNIYSFEEYLKRLREVKKLAKRFKIKVQAEKYDHEVWKKAIAGFEDNFEGGTRCELCFLHRLLVVASYAKKAGALSFATTLTISPHKNTEIINRIGEGVGKMIGIDFLSFDFKKDNGFSRSIEISKEFKLYRQKYCGCEFSDKSFKKIVIKTGID